MAPETRYARSGEVSIAYQIVGDGPVDLVWIPSLAHHVELNWENPVVAGFLRRLASVSRLLVFDKRGTGMSDRVAGSATLEERMDDIRAVMDAAGSERAVVSGLGDGTLTLSVISTDLAGNVSSVRTVTVTKDTTAPGAPTAAYTDNNNVADVVSGTAEANASISLTKTAPAPTARYSTTANGAGAYSAAVAIENGKPNTPISVTYTVTATDAAGNTSSASTLSFNDTH